MKNYFFLLIVVSSLFNSRAICNDTCKNQPVVSHDFWITLHAREAEIYGTRFNTLAFRPYESAASSAEKLRELGFELTVKDQDAMLNITVDELCTDFLPVNVSKTIQLKSKDELIMDSLANELIRNERGPIGLEYIEKLWILPQKPNIRFIPAEREEIIALVFKVRSLDKAALYLESKGLLGKQSGNQVEMDIGWAQGIRIILTQ